MEPVLIFRMIVALLGIGGTVVSYQLFLAVNQDGKTSMVKLQLNPAKTKRQFELILGFLIMAVVALSVYLIGAVFAHQTIFTIGRGLIILAAVPIVYVFYQWWQVF
ncbi:MAG: hypothetical protein MUP66_03695 [Candidatus Nanohaloarchaeota archaeon QJJ-5]|nr:hypothetical protein [Candidatus Nanohaloarchaeota archaeon QJJ-5]